VESRPTIRFMGFLTLAEYVRRARVDRKLSTIDVERESGGRISSSYVSRIENGMIANVSPEKLDALAAGLGIPAEDLYRVARGLSPERPKERLEMLAETFGGDELTERDWAEIEAVVKTMIEQKRQRK
jgi:transcriptional regulator with XRE-family HTH domain